jgi:hypothetical protein
MIQKWAEGLEQNLGSGAIASKTIVHGKEKTASLRMAGIAGKCRSGNDFDLYDSL